MYFVIPRDIQTLVLGSFEDHILIHFFKSITHKIPKTVPSRVEWVMKSPKSIMSSSVLAATQENDRAEDLPLYSQRSRHYQLLLLDSGTAKKSWQRWTFAEGIPWDFDLQTT